MQAKPFPLVYEAETMVLIKVMIHSFDKPVQANKMILVTESMT